MFSNRSYKKELLDGENIPFDDIRQNMKELDVINRWLGGHRITLKGVKEILQAVTESPVRVLEIGCGDGNNLRQLHDWAKKAKIGIELSGVDINPECIAYARSLEENNPIQFTCSDYQRISPETKPHIIFSSLFCHHFNDEEMITLLKWKEQNAITGFFINDLHRHPLAFFSIRLLTRLFSKSYLVRNDAPLSVARSFTRGDWKKYFDKAGITGYAIHWKWAFRWLIIFKR